LRVVATTVANHPPVVVRRRQLRIVTERLQPAQVMRASTGFMPFGTAAVAAIRAAIKRAA